jgi:GABA permease
MVRYLVVANQTLAADALLREIWRRADEARCSFHVVVPATHPEEQLLYTQGEARAVAERRLEEVLAWLSGFGIDADGEVGDERPIDAVRDALQGGAYDGIIVSTLPPGLSRWIKQDLPNRVARAVGLPVHHVIGVRWTAPLHT